MAYSLRIAEVSHNPEHGEDWPAVLPGPIEKYGFCPVLRC